MMILKSFKTKMKTKRVAKSRSWRSKKTVTKAKHHRVLHRNPQKVLAKRQVRRRQPIHRRVLLHPVTVLILLCVGVFIIGWTYEVIAQDFTVSAVVPALPLGQGATITYPIDSATLTNTPVTVTGLCPNGSYVKLSDNGTFVGVAWCTVDGAFQIETDLFLGANTLLASDYNNTDQPGPVTPSITVTYKPTGSSKSSSSRSTTAKVAPPLLLTSDFHYQAFLVGNDFSWPIGIEGGVVPYTVRVDWGDSQTSTTSYKRATVFQISHIYKAQGYYVIKIYATDEAGNNRLLQVAALIKLPGAVGVFAPTNGSTGSGAAQQNGFLNFLSNTQDWLWLLWPSFIIVLLMLLSFWLGERQEYQDLLRRQRLRLLRRRTSRTYR